MDNFLFQLFKNIPDEAVPDSLHTSIVRAVAFKRLRRLIIALAIIACASFLISGWYVYMRLVELDFVESFKFVISNFVFDFDSIRESWDMLSTSIPATALVISLSNLIVAAFMLYAIRAFNRIQATF